MSLRSGVRSSVPAGLAAMIVGAWGAWVAHANAGMAFGVPDLVEFVKFMSRAGLTAVVREWFYLPALGAALGLALWAGARPRWRFPLAAGALLVTLVALPPYPDVLRAARSPEDRLSFWMSLVTFMAVVAAAGIGPRLPRRAVAAGLLLLTFGCTAPAMWQFICLSQALARLYGAPVQVGWGLVATVAGSLLVIGGGGLDLIELSRRRP